MYSSLVLSKRWTGFDRWQNVPVTTGRIRRDRNLARHAMSDRVFPAVTSGGAKFSDRQPRQSDLSSGFRREMRVASLAVRETTISCVFRNRPCLMCTYNALSMDAQSRAIPRALCRPPTRGIYQLLFI